MKDFPRTGVGDLARLLTRLATGWARRRPGAEAIAGWLRDTGTRLKSPDFVIALGPRRVLFVSSPELSNFVLDQPPSERAFVAGTMKRKAMSFLAPNALTILNDAPWREMRRFNEDVLSMEASYATAEHAARAAAEAFRAPVADIADLRERMGQAMLEIVFGDRASEDHAATIRTLFAEVGLKTALFGSRKSAERDRFHVDLARAWDEARGRGSTLLARGRTEAKSVAAPYRREELLVHQIPHWMFTFSASGADLLAASLALILSRPDCLRDVRAEIDGAPADDANAIDRLRYLDACIREAGRLYPPAPQTSHRAATDIAFGGRTIPAGSELLQYFPVANRDPARDPHAEAFRPERWLDPADPVHRQRTNTFLSGARACPGRDLILLVIKAALIRQLEGDALGPRETALSRDPVPFALPDAALSFAP